MVETFCLLSASASRILLPTAESWSWCCTCSVQSEPRGSLCGAVVPCAVAFTRCIEADLEAFSPGRVAAHDGHGRLAEGTRAFQTFM